MNKTPLPQRPPVIRRYQNNTNPLCGLAGPCAFSR